jgi:Patatin-like phospholipase
MNEMRPPRAKARKHISAIACRYDRVALVLQGGGALGAYQIGVHQALAEAGCEPNWISGVSIGASRHGRLDPAIQTYIFRAWLPGSIAGLDPGTGTTPIS